MRRLMLALVAVLSLGALVAPGPATATTGLFAFDSVYATQSQSLYHAKDFAGGGQGDPKVQVKAYARKQTNGIGWVVTQINLDSWEDGQNPANVPCGPTTNSVKGTVWLTRMDANGDADGNLRTWDVVELCNGDGGNEILLGGDNAISFNSNGFRVRYNYRVAIEKGHDFDGGTQLYKRSTGSTSWAFTCGGTQNLDFCDEYQAGA